MPCAPTWIPLAGGMKWILVFEKSLLHLYGHVVEIVAAFVGCPTRLLDDWVHLTEENLDVFVTLGGQHRVCVLIDVSVTFWQLFYGLEGKFQLLPHTHTYIYISCIYITTRAGGNRGGNVADLLLLHTN